MENFKIQSRYRKLCYRCSAFIRCMKAAFYRPDYQKFLMFPLIKRVGQAFVSKHVAEPFKFSAEILENSAKLLRIYEKTKNSVKSLKSSAACLCYISSDVNVLGQLLIFSKLQYFLVHISTHCKHVRSMPLQCYYIKHTVSNVSITK